MTSTSPLRASLSARLRIVRVDRFGDGQQGLATLEVAMGLPAATWRNYEAGVVMPAEILLKFIELTRVNSHWLLTGDGLRYADSTLGRMLPRGN